MVNNNLPQNNKNIQYQAVSINFTNYIQVTDNYIEGDRKTHTPYDNHYSYGVLLGDSPTQALDIDFINCTNNTFNGFDIAIYVPNSSYHNSFTRRIDNTNFFHYLYQYYTYPTNLIQ